MTVDQSLELLGGVPYALAHDGWAVHVVSAPGPQMDALEREGLFTCHRLPMERQPHLLADIAALWRWVRALKAVKPDVVSCGTPKASFLGLTAAFILRTPVRVYLLRGLRLEAAAGLQFFLLSLAELMTAMVATHIISVSPSLRHAYLTRNLASDNKVVVLGHGSSKGVDLTRFRPAKLDESHDLEALAATLGLQPNIPVIGFVGRLHKDKGLDVFVDALQHTQLRHLSWQLLIVGSDESRGRLTRLIKSTFPHNSVLAEPRDVAGCYRLMNVLCLPTRREGMPNVVLEALASGTPVITTDATGAKDSIADGVNGIQVAQGSSAELSAALLEVLTDLELQKRLADQARRWVESRFSAPSVTRNQQEFYVRALSEALHAHHGRK